MEHRFTETIPYGVFDRNGFVFSRETVINAVDKFKTGLDEHPVFGELDHPDTSPSALNFCRAAALIDSVDCESDGIHIGYRILTSPGYDKHGIASTPGDTAMLVRSTGHPISIDPRFRSDGEGIDIVTWDIVSPPPSPKQ